MNGPKDFLGGKLAVSEFLKGVRSLCFWFSPHPLACPLPPHSLHDSCPHCFPPGSPGQSPLGEPPLVRQKNGN